MKKYVVLFLALVASSLLRANVHYISDQSLLPNDPRELYIDLVKKSVLNLIYEDCDPLVRDEGRDWPQKAHSMIGMKRLNNVHDLLKDVLENDIKGDCIETGVWRGGATILMRAILKAYGDTTRRVWVADSFAGLPRPDLQRYPYDEGLDLCDCKELCIPLSVVQSNFKKYDLLDGQVVFLEGFFENTLGSAPIEKISLLRLDGDLYQSTIEALRALYPKLSVGGYVIIDDYGCIAACAQAVTDYRLENGITDSIQSVDWTGVYWKKTK